MATRDTVSEATPKKTRAQVLQEQKQEVIKQRFEQANEAFKRLRNYKERNGKTYNVFDKELLRSYFRNIVGYEGKLRGLSWFLYYRSQVYARICNFYANMFCLYARSVIPNYDLSGNNNAAKILKSFQDTVDELDKMRLQQEFYPIILTCFIQDVSYNIWIEDNDGVFVLPWPADYARIAGKYMTGDFAMAIDASYLRGHSELLEYFPEIFEEPYNEYLRTNEKWQPIDQKYDLTMKYRVEDLDTILGPLAPIMNSIINLIDLEDIQAAADEQDIYKLIWLELETITGSDEPDDWRVDPALVTEYYKRLDESLPETIASAIVPGKLNEISFPDNAASDTTKVAKATETVLNTAGGAEILNGSTINNTFAFKMAMIANSEYAISSLLPQIQSWVNRHLNNEVGNDACKVKFFPVTVYTKDDYKEQLLTAGQNGFSTKLAYNTFNGFSEKDTMALNFFEEDVLHLSEKLVPLSTSYTQSGEVGRPETPDDELSDSGDRTRDTAG